MIALPPPFILRPMARSDIPAVLEIDRLSFPTPTKANLYEHELVDNQFAHYYVLAVLSGNEEETILGHVGYWMLADEIHISTIAITPVYRGRRLSELLMLQVLFDAFRLHATLVTLEVRRSNLVAQSLYRKYRFELVGERPRYYHDTGEDALLMTVELDPAYHTWLESKRDALIAHLVSSIPPNGV